MSSQMFPQQRRVMNILTVYNTTLSLIYPVKMYIIPVTSRQTTGCKLQYKIIVFKQNPILEPTISVTSGQEWHAKK